MINLLKYSDGIIRKRSRMIILILNHVKENNAV